MKLPNYADQSIVTCQRCGDPCKAEPGRATARPFRQATRGLCAACVVWAFFIGDEDNGVGFALAHGFNPQYLRLPHIQAQFSRVLTAGNSELTMAEIDWDVVIAKWNLPAPKTLCARREAR